MDTNIGIKGHFSYNKLFKLLIDKGIKKKASANWLESVRPLLRNSVAAETPIPKSFAKSVAPSTVM